MEFIKSLIKNRRLIVQLGKNDFKNKFASTSLGAVWGFVQPFVFMFTYVIVFQFILKTQSSGDYPFVVWYLPGLAMWQFINDSVINGSNSIRNYSYLVKKVVFPVDVIPIISFTSSLIIGMFLFIISIVVSLIFGFIPNVLLLAYMIIAAISFLISLIRFTSAISTLVPDFTNLISVIMQLMFWFTPIMWNISQIAKYEVLSIVVKCMPFSYLITGFRQVFISEDIITSNYGIYTIVFWVFTLLIFIWGNSIFKRGKKDFADVL